MKVVIIGSGNVASVLGKQIKEAGHHILEVAGRNKEQVNLLACELNTAAVHPLTTITSLGDIYIIAVADNAIREIADELRVNNKIVVHTAAAVHTDVLACCSTLYGVIYPLQTLRKSVTNIPPIPVLIDGSSETVTETLRQFTSNWASSTAIANDEERLKLHLAAVFVNNFTNHLFTVAYQFCYTNHLDFTLLQPLIFETIHRLQYYNPSAVQTGPAVRNDQNTIEKHRQLLSDNIATLELYNHLTQSIQAFYNSQP